MSDILYIKASPRKERSFSISVADAFIEEYLKNNSRDNVKVLDLFNDPIPEFDLKAAKGKYNIMHGKEYTEEEKKAWSAVTKIIDEFKSADKYVFAVPMWNFSIPYKLKQYIDIIVQPTYTFGVTEEGGYVGLLEDRPTFISYARGGEYKEEQEAIDHQKKYLELMLAFMGIKDIKSVITQPTIMVGPDAAAEKKTQSIEKAVEYANNF